MIVTAVYDKRASLCRKLMGKALDFNQHAAEYAQHGYTVIRGLLTKPDAAKFLAEVERCAVLDSQKAALNGNGIGFAGEIFLHSEFARSVLTRPDVIALVSAIAGGDLWISMDQAVTKHPGAGIFRWHQDNGYNQLKREHFQLWIALTETRQQNGALKLVPGSHKRGLLPHTFKGVGQMEVAEDVGEHVTIDADAGDVIVFSSLMLHCTGPNEADSKRVAYVAEYMKLSDYAPGAGAPYFIVAEGGKPNPHFTRVPPGALSLRNQLMYLRPRLIAAAKRPARLLREAVLQRL
jgi:ectoine hydroxylase-related dioxygenase (phytanoyl-CoA dioxygenase family)